MSEADTISAAAELMGTFAKNKRRKERSIAAALKRYNKAEGEAVAREEAANTAARAAYPVEVMECVRTFGYGETETVIEVDESDLEAAE
jgi:hypothetical protein